MYERKGIAKIKLYLQGISVRRKFFVAGDFSCFSKANYLTHTL